MLENIFNSSGIGRSTHILNVENEKLYYGSSSNIIVYEDERITPILREGSDITHLKIRDGIILCDTDNRVEINNKFHYIAEEAITAVSKTAFTIDGNIGYDFAIFSTLSQIYIIFDQKIYPLILPNIVCIDCMVENGFFIVYCGDLHGVLYKISVPLSNFVGEIPSNKNHNIFTLFESNNKPKNLEKIIDSMTYELKTNKVHEDTISSVKIGKGFVITCSHDCSLRLVDLNTLKQIDSLVGHSDIVYDCFYDHESNHILSVGADNTVISWKNENGWRDTARVGNRTNIPFFGVVKLRKKENDIIYVQDYHGSLFKYVNFQLTQSLSGNTDKVTTCDVKNDLILTGSSDFSVRIYKEGQEIARPSIHGYPIQSAVFHGKFVAIGSEESIIRVYEPTTPVENLILSRKQEEKTVQIATPSELSLTNEIKNVEIFDLNEHSLQNILCFKERKKLYGQFFSNSALAANKDLILCANKSANLKFSGIFVFYDFKAVQYIAVNNLGITKIEISPDGKYVIAVSRDRNASLYEIKDYFSDEKNEANFINKKMNESKKYLHFLSKIKIHDRAINSVSFNETGSLFATSSKDKTVKIFNMLSLECIHNQKFETEVTAIRFFENHLFVGQSNGMLSICSVDLKIIFSLKAHSKKINEIKCSFEKIITVGDDWLIRVFRRI